MITVLTKLLDMRRQTNHFLLVVAALFISTPTIAGEVLFVSDSVTDAENIPAVLSGNPTEVPHPSIAGAGYRPAFDGTFHNVTIIRNDYQVTGGSFGLAEGTNQKLEGDLSGYCSVFWSASGPHEPLGLQPGTGLGADGGLHTDADVFTNIMNYVQTGGFVFVTGNYAITHPHDSSLIEFVGGSAQPPAASAGQQVGPSYGLVGGPPIPTAITNNMNGNPSIIGMAPIGGGINQVDTVQEQDYLVLGADPNVTVLVQDSEPGLVPAAAGWTVRHPLGTADEFVNKGHIAYVANGVFFYETEQEGEEAGSTELETLSDGEDPSWLSMPYSGALRNFADTSCISLPFDENQTPVADDQAVSTDTVTPINITLTGSDPNDDPIEYSIVTFPTFGVIGGAAPIITYTPIVVFTGDQTLEFVVCDGTRTSDPGIVTITVVAPPPSKCEIDGDGDIDRDDITVIFGLRGTTSPPSPSAADLDDNGIININDGRGCVLRCTRPRCATE